MKENMIRKKLLLWLFFIAHNALANDQFDVSLAGGALNFTSAIVSFDELKEQGTGNLC